MHVPINVKSPNNISEWQMGFNSAFKGLNICSDFPDNICPKKFTILRRIQGDAIINFNMPLGLTQPLTEMSSRNISWG
jgi:hypothetical protein